MPEAVLFHGEISDIKCAVKRLDSPHAQTAHQLYFKKTLDMVACLSEVEALAERDPHAQKEGGRGRKRNYFEKLMNRIIDYVRLLPQRDINLIEMLVVEVLKEIASGVKPQNNDAGRRWARAINRGRRYFGEAYGKAADEALKVLPKGWDKCKKSMASADKSKKGLTSCPHSTGKDENGKDKTGKDGTETTETKDGKVISDKNTGGSCAEEKDKPAAPKNKIFLMEGGTLEELREMYPGIMEGIIRALEVFRGGYITNNRIENVWGNTGRSKRWYDILRRIIKMSGMDKRELIYALIGVELWRVRMRGMMRGI